MRQFRSRTIEKACLPPRLASALSGIIEVLDECIQYSHVCIDVLDDGAESIPSHKDTGNFPGTMSVIVAFGNFEGGGLEVEGQAYDIKHRPLVFNGREQAHATTPLRGCRYSVVGFTPGVKSATGLIKEGRADANGIKAQQQDGDICTMPRVGALNPSAGSHMTRIISSKKVRQELEQRRFSRVDTPDQVTPRLLVPLLAPPISKAAFQSCLPFPGDVCSAEVSQLKADTLLTSPVDVGSLKATGVLAFIPTRNTTEGPVSEQSCWVPQFILGTAQIREV